MVILVVAIIGDIDIHIIERMNKCFFIWSVVGKHKLAFDHGICIAANNAAFKPGHDFSDDGNIIIDSQERKIRHFRVNIGVDTFSGNCVSKRNLICIPFKNFSSFFPCNSFTVKRFKDNFVFFQRKIVTVFVFINSKEDTEFCGLISRGFVKKKWERGNLLLKNKILSVFS